MLNRKALWMNKYALTQLFFMSAQYPQLVSLYIYKIHSKSSEMWERGEITTLQ